MGTLDQEKLEASASVIKIAVGTTNKCKVKAVEETANLYPQFQNCKILTYKVDSGVGNQPLNLETIVQGSKNRAEEAMKLSMDSGDKASLAVGIESGLFCLTPCVSDKYKGWFDTSVCTVYDGVNHYLGTSCSFEVPSIIMKDVLDNGVELSQACHNCGITANRELGEAEGLIGILTNGRITRLDYTMQGLKCCFIPIENKT